MTRFNTYLTLLAGAKLSGTKHFARMLGLVAIMLLSACAQLPGPSGDDTSQQANIAQPKQPGPEDPLSTLPERSFAPETLYSLLVAELAGQRGRADIMLRSYLHQAQKTRDPGVAERAAKLGIILQSPRVAYQASRLWYEISPDNINAKRAYSVQLVRAKRFDEAMDLMEAVVNAGGKPNFDFLAVNSKGLEQSQRNNILMRLDKLIETYPDQASLLFAKTILLDTSDQTEAALEVARELRELDPTTANTILAVKLRHKTGDTDGALKELDQALQRQHKNKEFRILKAQFYIEQQNYIQAEKEYEKLVSAHPEDGPMRLTYGLLTLENKSLDIAKQQFEALLVLNDEVEEAHYYLGRLAVMAEDPEAAIEHFLKVSEGDKIIPAYKEAGDILLAQQRLTDMNNLFNQQRLQTPNQAINLFLLEAELLEDGGFHEAAMALLHTALVEHPNHIGLLYARAMSAEKIDDLVMMEEDLRTIISLEPDNATALNALGYTLADRTTRYEEALALIERANELKPNDPAITDSLGWAQYRLGNYPEAIALLEQALADYPDHEVAAHLGEVLWMSGDKARAKQVWVEALELSPDSPILLRVIQRLSPELIE